MKELSKEELVRSIRELERGQLIQRVRELEEEVKELEEERDGPHFCGLIDHGPYCECGRGLAR